MSSAIQQELLDKCHPLGMFDSIATLAVASNMRELYRLVLVDTPLAPYFSENLTHEVCVHACMHGHMAVGGCACMAVRDGYAWMAAKRWVRAADPQYSAWLVTLNTRQLCMWQACMAA